MPSRKRCTARSPRHVEDRILGSHAAAAGSRPNRASCGLAGGGTLPSAPHRCAAPPISRRGNATSRLLRRGRGDRGGDEPDSPASMTTSQLCAYHLALVDLATRALAAEVTVAADSGAIHGGLRAVIARYLPPDAAIRAAITLTVPDSAIAHTERASAAVFAGPTWTELDAAPAILAPPTDRIAVMREIASRHWPGDAVRRWLRQRQIERLTAEASRQLERRERAKRAILVLDDEVRRIHLELGRRLTCQGLLARPDHVELLRIRELHPALQESRVPSRTVLERRRRWLHRHEEEGPLPPNFRGIPEPDEVLVASARDPSWAPLLVRCGAIVIERGEPHSHAAILAREFGVPAVFNLPGAAAVLDG